MRCSPMCCLPRLGVRSLRPCCVGCLLMPSSRCFVYFVRLLELKDESSISKSCMSSIHRTCPERCAIFTFMPYLTVPFLCLDTQTLAIVLQLPRVFSAVTCAQPAASEQEAVGRSRWRGRLHP